MQIAGIAVCRGRDGPFIAMPRMPQLDPNRCQRRDASGKPLFEQAPIIRWTDPARAAAFQRALLTLIARDAAGLLGGQVPLLLDEREATL